MKQLQFAEYLDILDQRVGHAPAMEQLESTALRQAEEIWPELKLGRWDDRNRAVEYIANCGATRLVHITADHKDCFLILEFPPGESQATRYLLFDIGAEYRDIWLECPEFEIDEPADADTIRDIIPR